MGASGRALVGIVSLVLAVVVAFSSTGTVAAQDAQPTMLVANTDGQGANMRVSPSTDALTLTVVPEGIPVLAIGEPIQASGRTWRRVVDVDGRTGYIASDFLVPTTDTTSPNTSPRGMEVSQPEVRRPPADSPRCYDAVVRFRYGGDPRMTLRIAMADAGWQVINNPFARFYLDAAPRIVSGWVSVSLLRERRGYAAPTLGEWLADGYTMSFGLSPAEWDEMATWEPTSCEGAFLWNPANLDLIAMMRLIVSTTREPSIPLPFIPNSPLERLECPSDERVALADLAYSKVSGNTPYTLVSGRLTNLCAYTVKASVSLKIESDMNSGNNSGPSGIVLGPGESYRFTDFSTERVHGRIRSLVGTVQVADCPERIC